jgi:hypothetical protein
MKGFSLDLITMPRFNCIDNPDCSSGHSDISMSNTGSIYLHHWANNNLQDLLMESWGNSTSPSILWTWMPPTAHLSLLLDTPPVQPMPSSWSHDLLDREEDLEHCPLHIHPQSQENRSSALTFMPALLRMCIPQMEAKQVQNWQCDLWLGFCWVSLYSTPLTAWWIIFLLFWLDYPTGLFAPPLSFHKGFPVWPCSAIFRFRGSLPNRLHQGTLFLLLVSCKGQLFSYKESWPTVEIVELFHYFHTCRVNRKPGDYPTVPPYSRTMIQNQSIALYNIVHSIYSVYQSWIPLGYMVNLH